MKRRVMILNLLLILLPAVSSAYPWPAGYVPLPDPPAPGVTLEEAMSARRSVRSYSGTAVGLDELAGLLFAAQGITSPLGFRTAPSAGATYPLQILVAVSRVDSLQAGIYSYSPEDHSLQADSQTDCLAELGAAALGQPCVSSAALVLVIAADFSRTTSRYGERGESYVYIEVGHAAQNIYLVCEAMGLATVAVGAFSDDEVSEVLGLPEDLVPLYLMPVGEPAETG